MNSKSQLTTLKLEDLVLDVNNLRFTELYNGSQEEYDLINYLLFNESAEEVAKAIVNSDEFYPDKPLWVLRKGKKYAFNHTAYKTRVGKEILFFSNSLCQPKTKNWNPLIFQFKLKIKNPLIIYKE